MYVGASADQLHVEKTSKVFDDTKQHEENTERGELGLS